MTVETVEAVDKPQATGKRLFTVPQAAERLNIGNTLMNKLIQTGEIDSVKVGAKCRRVSEAAIDRYLEKIGA